MQNYSHTWLPRLSFCHNRQYSRLVYKQILKDCTHRFLQDREPHDQEPPKQKRTTKHQLQFFKRSDIVTVFQRFTWKTVITLHAGGLVIEEMAQTSEESSPSALLCIFKGQVLNTPFRA